MAGAKIDLSLTEVAPITGAWIETTGVRLTIEEAYVAPITGAWIETESIF